MEETNYTSATIFWLYIVFALLFSGIVLHTIYHLPGSTVSHRHRTSAWIFTALALLSFSVLSVNMLNVLLHSFAHYRAKHPEITFSDLPVQIYHWSFTTPLFLEFGEAILADSRRSLWTQTSLFATLWVCLFMAAKGQQQRVPKLWVFFAVSQILPISYAQNLFYLALLRLPARSNRADQREGKNDGRLRTQTRNTPVMTVVVVVVAYIATLLYAPSTAGTKSLIPVILMARALLLCPLVLVYWSRAAGDGLAFIQRSSFMQFLLMCLALLIAIQARTTLAEVSFLEMRRALMSHPAVSVLGIDFLLCLCSCVIWMLRGRQGTASGVTDQQ